MKLLGPRLYWPKAAAVLLCLYAAGYALLMLYFVFIAFEVLGAFVLFLGILPLAVTPFMALIHLSRATTPDSKAPVRPKYMTMIMTAPTVFWSYIALRNLSYQFPDDADRIIMLIGLIAVPAILSLWLLVTFVLLALRKTLPTDQP